MDYFVSNCAPDADQIYISVGNHADSQISVTISRDANGEVHVVFVDNLDNYRQEMVLGKESNPIQFGSRFID